MLLLLKLAWRNILRQKRRTLLATSAVSFGLAAMIAADGLMLGMIDTMVRTATSTLMGDAQVHAPGFMVSQDIDKSISDFPRLMQELANDANVEATAPRVIATVMIASAENVTNVRLYGVDPVREPKLSRFQDVMRDGDYLTSEEKNKVLIGSKMAKDLGVGVGDRLVLTAAAAGTAEMAQALFRVGGVFHFGSRQMDAGIAVMTMQDARALLQMPETAHEVAIRYKNADIVHDPAAICCYGNAQWEIQGWPKLMPSLEAMIRMSGASMSIVGLILFSVIALGIINTIFMSIYERTFEFGVLKAVGTRATRIFAMILAEGGLLAALSVPGGIALGIGFNLLLNQVGIDYTGAEFSGVTLTELIYPQIRSEQYTIFPLIAFAITTLAAVYPAIHAARIIPAQALHKSL